MFIGLNHNEKQRTMLKITKLNKTFGKKHVIRDLDLMLNSSGLYVLVGANGVGKTTLLNMITGVLLMDDGDISFVSERGDEADDFLGISPEPFVTEQSLTLWEIAEICCSIKQRSVEEFEKQLLFWQLEEYRNSSFKTLSTGTKKRLSLALSLVANPDVIVWDEPFNGLDPIGIELLNRKIDDLVGEGKFLLISTHLLNQVVDENAHFLVMKDGEIKKCLHGNTEANRSEIINIIR